MDNKELAVVLEVVAEDLNNRFNIDTIGEQVPALFKPLLTMLRQKLDSVDIKEIINLYNTDEVLAEINNRLKGSEKH